MTKSWVRLRRGSQAGPGDRTVLLHHHLFKNAGTSLDALLKRQFPGKWVTREFQGDRESSARQVATWIEDNPGAVCFSSHTARITPTPSTGTRVVPIVFVRHPLDRIASAYSFERGQLGSGFGATLARNTTLRGYIETRLSVSGDRQCRNFHVDRLADMFPVGDGTELSRALRAVDALPFIGVVESFGESLQRLRALLDVEGFGRLDLLPLARNVSKDRSASLAGRLDDLAAEIGPEFYDELLSANREDLTLYETVVARSASWAAPEVS